MANNIDEHQLKLKTLHTRLASISNEFERELIKDSIHKRKEKYSLHKDLTISSSSLQQEQQPQTNLSSIQHHDQKPQHSETKPSTLQKQQQISSKEHLTLREDLKSGEYSHSLSDEKILQKVKPNWESWESIPKEDLKSGEYSHSLSDEKILQKVKPNWESWKYISEEDLKSGECSHSLSDEKILQKVKPNWESWKYIPKEDLDRLKKKTLTYILKE